MVASQVLFTDLQLGELLAEGGEGRVFEVVRTGSSPARAPTAMVYKQLRQPRPLAELNLLCDVPA